MLPEASGMGLLCLDASRSNVEALLANLEKLENIIFGVIFCRVYFFFSKLIFHSVSKAASSGPRR